VVGKQWVHILAREQKEILKTIVKQIYLHGKYLMTDGMIKDQNVFSSAIFA
jgi:hypothetical protein